MKRHFLRMAFTGYNPIDQKRICRRPIQNWPVFAVSVALGNEKAELPQRRPRDAPYVWVPWKVTRVPDFTHGYFARYF